MTETPKQEGGTLCLLLMRPVPLCMQILPMLELGPPMLIEGRSSDCMIFQPDHNVVISAAESDTM